MMICAEPMIEGRILPALTYSIHARERMDESQLSQGYLNRELKAGGFKVIRKFATKVWRLRQGNIEMIVDMVARVIVTIILTTPNRMVISDAKLGSIVSTEQLAKIRLNCLIRERTRNPQKYSVFFQNMNVIKKIKE